MSDLYRASEMVEDAALLTPAEQTLVNAARIVGAFPNRVPWVQRATLRFAAHMLLEEKETDDE